MQERMTNEKLIKKYKRLKEQNKVDAMNMELKKVFDNNAGLIQDRINKAVRNRKRISQTDIEDIEEVAKEAIWHAVENYDKNKGVEFTTYAVVKIDSFVKDWLRDNHLIKIPVKIQKLFSRYYEVVEEYKANNKGENPSEEYIKESLNVSKKQYYRLLDAIKAYDIESFSNNDGEESVINQMPDHHNNQAEIFKKVDDEEFETMVSKLKNEKERKVIKGYFYGKKKLSELSKELGVTKQRIYKIKKDALIHLKQMPEVIDMATEIGILRECS